MNVSLETEVEPEEECEELQEERVKLAHDRGLIEYRMTLRLLSSSTYLSSGTFFENSMNCYKECFHKRYIQDSEPMEPFDDVWRDISDKFYYQVCSERTNDYNILSRWLGVGPYHGLNHRSIADLYEKHMVDYYDKELPYIHELLEW